MSDTILKIFSVKSTFVSKILEFTVNMKSLKRLESRKISNLITYLYKIKIVLIINMLGRLMTHKKASESRIFVKKSSCRGVGFWLVSVKRK